MSKIQPQPADDSSGFDGVDAEKVFGIQTKQGGQITATQAAENKNIFTKTKDDL